MGQDLRGVEPGFSDCIRQAERVKLVGGFIAVVAAIVATMDVEGILRGGGCGSYDVPRVIERF